MSATFDVNLNGVSDIRYEKRIFGKYVYHGVRGLDRPTRYVTNGPWDGKMLVQLKDGEIQFCDFKGKRIFVFEDDEDGYHRWA